MGDLVRFGVAMERGLLLDFDRRIAARGYENRSEALRDLVRADLVQEAWEAGATVMGTLTLVLAVEAREVVLRVADIEADPKNGVISSMRVPMEGGRTLVSLALRGRAGDLSALAGRIGGARGVLSSQLALVAIAEDAAGEADR